MFWLLFWLMSLYGLIPTHSVGRLPFDVPLSTAPLQEKGRVARLTFWQSVAVGIPFDGIEVLLAAA